MGLSNFPNGITSFGIPIYGPGQGHDISGKTFFVDANVLTSGGDGKSWDTAYKTIAVGLAASQAQISKSSNRAWAKRNTVYYCGDDIKETLVLAAEKTDLIGVGTDINSLPKVTGNFTIGIARSGFRIINMGFIPTTTAPVITFPSGMHGWELHGVHLFKVLSVTNSAMLLSTDCRDFRLINSYIYPDVNAAVATIGFNIAGTATGLGRAIIDGCLICGATALNVVDTSAYYEGALCKNTILKATALCVDDNSDSILFVDNRLISAGAITDSDGTGIADWNLNLICNNYCHAVDADGPIPALQAPA